MVRTKLRLHQPQGNLRPHADPNNLPQFTPEEQTEAKEHADSWIERADLENVKVSAKTIPPPPQEPSRAGPMRTGRGGRGGGGSRAPPFPLKTLAGGALDQPPSPQSGQALDQWVLNALTRAPPLLTKEQTPQRRKGAIKPHLHTDEERSIWRKRS